MPQPLTTEGQPVIGGQFANYADQLRAALTPLLEELLPVIRRVAVVLAEPRAPDYETLLIEIGYAPFEARALSIWAIASARGYAKDLNIRRRNLGSALRQIVDAADKSRLVRARRAAALLPQLDDWTRVWIENGLEESGLPHSFTEFQLLVREAANREPCACDRLRELAPLLFRHVPKARGASLSTATVTHALLLMIAAKAGHGAAYTHSPDQDDFTDRLTVVTRRQLQQPRFSPIAARRLVKTLKWIHREGLLGSR